MTARRTQLADPRTVQRAGIARKMNKSEAQALTQQIRATAHGLWRLVAEAYDRKAWQALGYGSWKAYAEEELQMSESRSYQLVDTGRVMKAIAEVAGPDVIDGVVVTARETAKIKPHMSTFKRELEQAIKDGVDADQAVEIAIEALPSREPAVARTRDGARIVEGRKVREEVRQPEPELPPIYAPTPAPLTGKRVVPPPAALFSAASDAVDQPLPATPRGRKVCPTCDGHGYV